MADRSPPKRGSAFFRGSAGMQRTDEELEHAKQKAEERKQAGNKPFRFRVPIGETRQVIVCDDKPDFFLYEHSLKDSEGNWGKLFTGCTKTFDNCPVCESSGKESYYAMILTVVDLTPFSLRDGTTVEFSRKLLVVKPAQQKKFLRFFNKEGTLRGALFEMTRDGDKDSSIGNDIEFVEFVDEAEMETYVRSWKDKDGKKHTEKCDEPYVYEELFEEPSTEKLRALVGGAPPPGSRAYEDKEHNRSSRPAAPRGREAAAPARGRTGRAAPKDDDWDDAEDNAAYEEPAAPARRGRAAPEADAPPARAAGRGRAAPTPEPEEEEEAPAPRSAARRGAPVAAKAEAPAARRGRAAPQPWEGDDEPEAAPAPARRGRAAPVEDDAEDEPAPTRPRATRR